MFKNFKMRIGQRGEKVFQIPELEFTLDTVASGEIEVPAAAAGVSLTPSQLVDAAHFEKKIQTPLIFVKKSFSETKHKGLLATKRGDKGQLGENFAYCPS